MTRESKQHLLDAFDAREAIQSGRTVIFDRPPHGGKSAGGAIECDVCGKTMETEQADFNVAINIMRRNGWNARKIGKDWLHGCDRCGSPTGKELF